MTRHVLRFLLAAFAFSALPSAASAQERKQPTIPADGTEVLQYLLDRARIQPVKASEVWNLGRMDNVIVISLGNPNTAIRGGHTPLQMANQVIQRGGAALIAADSYVHFRNGNFNSDTMIPNGSVYGRDGTQPSSLFLERRSLPFVVPRRKPALATGPEWGLFDGLSRIATNKPSFILAQNPRGEFGSLLATYPEDCFAYDFSRVREEAVDPDKHFFAVGGSGEHPNFGNKYRFLALADPSVFINQMMLASDANGPVDNLEFAARVVAYLAEEDGRGPRTRCIFYQNGEIVERFDTLRSMMQPPLPLPNVMAMQDKLTDFANKIIDSFETDDIANKTILGREETERNQKFKWIMRAFLALFLIRIIYYFVRRTWMAKRPADGPAPPAGGLPATEKGERPPGIFDRRQRELLRRNNLYEPVRVLVRGMFAAAGAPENPGKRFPEVEISDVVTKPGTLVDALTDLWKIAYGPPRVVTVQRWKLLEPLFERVCQAHADGKWRFV